MTEIELNIFGILTLLVWVLLFIMRWWTAGHTGIIGWLIDKILLLFAVGAVGLSLATLYAWRGGDPIPILRFFVEPVVRFFDPTLAPLWCGQESCFP